VIAVSSSPPTVESPGAPRASSTLIIEALVLSPGYVTDRTVFAGMASSGVFKSTDGGISWSTMNTDLTDKYIRALAISPGYATDQTIFAGTLSGGVFKSTDGGVSWNAGNAGLIHLWTMALALSPDYAIDHTLFVGMDYAGGVFRSTDGGASWNAMNAGLGNLDIQSLALAPTFPRTLFAGTDGSSVWQYTVVPYRLWLLRVVKGYGMW
jgi:photosystem II stability/assembly factor-like uncharacterized protein